MTTDAVDPALLRPNADRFEPLPEGSATLARWLTFPELGGERTYFPKLVGLSVEELRLDYCRMRLAHRPELEQPAGVVHGGAIATLVDSVVVPAISSPYDRVPDMLTLHLGVSYLGALRRADAVAEGFVVQRGRRTVFCQVQVRSAADASLVATGELVYTVRPAEGPAS